MKKLKIGILFGGNSREREVSFAGGRTVYDNLNKSLFEPIPIFVDSFGNFVELDWHFIYKGSIRDFYPPIKTLADDAYQIYAEALGDLKQDEQYELLSQIGKLIAPEHLASKIDFAFLCVHGSNAEDGRLQGLLEYYQIPYSGSGILPSAIGMNKVIQKQWMQTAGFNCPKYQVVDYQSVFDGDYKANIQKIFNEVSRNFADAFVVKSANQGSSIGVSIVKNGDEAAFFNALLKSFFTQFITKTDWQTKTASEQKQWLVDLIDIRHGIGLPVQVLQPNHLVIYKPQDLLDYINQTFETHQAILLQALEAESQVLIEEFIEGKEFSCIVLRNTDGKALALPPTEIRKGTEVFDYRSKYLPGLSRKITPIDLPNEQIEAIATACENLFNLFHFNVYARIDGFIKSDGTIYLNDPNTTSGMMPSSFFFHQAAEIGLNPSQFLTYIIRTSVVERLNDFKQHSKIKQLLNHLDQNLQTLQKEQNAKIKVAVILGGYSSERHISVESGRNVYEKLASSEKYQPIPIFLTGNDQQHELYTLPINLLLKDNADDIKEKINHYKVHDFVKNVIQKAQGITQLFADSSNLQAPQALTYEALSKQVDIAFIALHGRPGEDGAVQAQLEKVNVPYNGSNIQSSQITINKFATNELLKANGIKVAEHLLINKQTFVDNPQNTIETITQQIPFPLIAKPVDDGCSSAVKKINNPQELEAFLSLMFRQTSTLDKQKAEVLKIKPNEEFPQKNQCLIEAFISKGDAKKMIEITGGMLTKIDSQGKMYYEVFEPSETLTIGDVLSLEEKFLAGEGQNITPARFSDNADSQKIISQKVKQELQKVAEIVNIEGYCRIDAFVKIFDDNKVEVVVIEVNSLPGMTPATCIFHQAAINDYQPYAFIDQILTFAIQKKHKHVE